MPLTWIYNLSKQQLEDLSGQLGLSSDGTLDDLRKRVKDKWTVIEPYLPPHSTAKFTQATSPMQSVVDSVTNVVTPLNKIKVKIVNELIASIPTLSGTDPEQIIQFLIRASEVLELRLLPDSEIMAFLITRTSGRIMQMIATHIGTTDSWGVVQSQIIATFLPHRVKEKFLTSMVLERFQAPSEDLTDYITSVVAAARILEFVGTEPQLVQRIVQNLHPKIRSHCIFQKRPESISELFSLSTAVKEAIAVEDQRKQRAASLPQGGAPRANTQGQTKVSPAEQKPECWTCGKIGHLQRACPSRTRPNVRATRSGNSYGARQ